MCLSFDLCHHPHRKSEGNEELAMAESMRKKSLDSPDETRTFNQGKSQVVSIEDFTITRNTLFPKPFLSTQHLATLWASTPLRLTSHPRPLEWTTICEPTLRSGMLKPYEQQRKPSMWSSPAWLSTSYHSPS